MQLFRDAINECEFMDLGFGLWALSVLILLDQTLRRWSFHLVEVG